MSGGGGYEYYLEVVQEMDVVKRRLGSYHCPNQDLLKCI